jgi:hypothetical protein
MNSCFVNRERKILLGKVYPFIAMALRIAS